MRVAIFGGSFNPPHLGHLHFAREAAEKLGCDRFLIVPAHEPPHKEMAEGSPTPQQRLEMCRLCFADIPNAEVSDIELKRGGRSYTADTLRELSARWPEAELVLLVGTDMLMTLDHWYDAAYLLSRAVIAAIQRAPEELTAIEKKAAELKARFGAKVEVLAAKPFPVSSTEIRAALPERGGQDKLADSVYAYIIRNRLYCARVSFDWLREKAYAMLKPKRIPHVRGCEEEAIRLAERWGADPEMAAEAAILHDCTKKAGLEEQLRLCEKYGIIPDKLEAVSEKLLHAKTGAALAQHEFGCAPEVVSAICWHTTGKRAMTLLEKIIYMADYMEPTRDFEGVERLRQLAYEDLDAAMALGLSMSLAEIRRYGNIPHPNSVNALRYYQRGTQK